MKKTFCRGLILLSCLFMAIPSVVMAYDLGGLSIHGFVSQGYLKSNDNNYLARTEDGTFEFNESAINFSIEPVDNLRIGLQLMSRDLGPSRNNDIYLDWGYADYRFNDAFGIRVGKIKVPHGLYNQTRDIDFLRTSIFLPQGVYSETQRDHTSAFRGGGIYGNLSIGGLGDLEYEALLGTSDSDQNSPIVKNATSSLDPLGGGSPGNNTYSEMEWGLAMALRWNTSLDGLRLGISNRMVKTQLGADYDIAPGMSVTGELELESKTLPVFSIEYTRNGLKLAAEYYLAKFDVDVNYDGVTVASHKTENEAYYGSVAYQFCDWFELGTYYSVYYPDRKDKDGDNQQPGMDYLAWQKDWAISAKFSLLGNLTLKLETHFIDGAADMFALENPQGREDNMVLYAAKCSVNF